LDRCLTRHWALCSNFLPLLLSHTYLSQSLGFPPSIFGESATFAAALQQHRRIDISATAEEPAAPADALASPSAAEADQSGELRAGTVAELLGRMAAGRLVLKAHKD
jgi:hypothetical protein